MPTIIRNCMTTAERFLSIMHVLQCVALCCTVLHVLQYVAVCIFCNCVLHVLHVLQCVAVCIFCNCVLCVAVCCSMLQCVHFVVPVGGLPRRPVLRGRV